MYTSCQPLPFAHHGSQHVLLQYILSEETVKYLKKPTFDIWHWEHNEMLSLLEHMYNELDLITELHINPITLRRWLVRTGRETVVGGVLRGVLGGIRGSGVEE